VAELGKRYEIMSTSIKKWTVGSPLQIGARLRHGAAEDPAVRAGKVKRIVVDIASGPAAHRRQTAPFRISACSTSSP